jgi:hypothetical protein
MLLKAAARVEFVSLVLLFANLATAHWASVASLVGPIHGCAYLFVIGATLRATKDVRTRVLSAVPGVGGLLATRRLAAQWPAEHWPAESHLVEPHLVEPRPAGQPPAEQPPAEQPPAEQPPAGAGAQGPDTLTGNS